MQNRRRFLVIFIVGVKTETEASAMNYLSIKSTVLPWCVPLSKLESVMDRVRIRSDRG